MLSSGWVDNGTYKSKIYHIDCVGVLSQAHHDIIRLNVSVHVVELVQVLDSLQHLIEYHQRRFQAELLSAEIEEVLEAGTE